MPVTPDQFAESIKKKYPQYANVPNVALAQSFVKKYPAYASQVDFSGAAPQTGPHLIRPSGIEAPPDYTTMEEKRTVAPNARFPQLGPGGYDVADFLAKSIPVGTQIAGAEAGTAIGGPVGGVTGAALGAAGGDRLERLAFDFLYKDLKPETKMEILQSMGLQASLGTLTEGVNQGFQGMTGPLTRGLKLAREAQADAKAGTGVRLTPGEAGNSPVIKTFETMFEHWPGGAGEMEKFRTGQEADVRQKLEGVLTKIHDGNLSQGEAGKLIRETILDAKKTLDPQLGPQLDQLQARMLNISNYRVGKTIAGLGPEEMTPEDLGKAVQEHVRQGAAEAEASTQSRLDQLRARQEQSKNELFQGEANALHPLEVPKEEVGKQVQASYREQKERSDQILKGNVDSVHAKQLADVNTVLDRQLKMISPQSLNREQSGLLVQGELSALKRQSEATVDSKFNEVRQALGKDADAHYTPEEFDKLVAEHPEAKAKLEEARLLYKQELERFSPPILQKVLTTTKPEDIADIMATAGIEDLRILNRFVSPQTQKAAARELMESMIYKATDRNGVVDPKSLATSFKNLQEDRGRLIFGTQYDTLLKDATGTIDGINEAADRARANYTRQANAPFEHPLIKEILTTTKPEDIAGKMEKAGLDELRATTNALPPETKQAASRAVLENMIERARDPQTGMIRGKELAKSLFVMSEERGRIIFGDRYDSIVQSAQKFQQINESAENMATQIKNENSKYNRELFKHIQTTTKPETIVGKLQTAGLEESRLLMSSLPPEMQQTVRRTVYQNMVDRARDPQTGLVNARKLAGSVSALQKRGPVIFGDQYANILETGKVLDRLGESAEKKASTLSTRSSRFNQQLYNNIVGTHNPELIGGFFRTAGPEELRDFVRTAAPETVAVARRSVVEDMFTPQARDVDTSELDPQIVTKNLKNGLQTLGRQRGELFFGKETWDDLTDASKLLDRITFSNDGPAARIHIAGIASAAIGLITGAVGGAVRTHDVKGALEGAAIGAGGFAAASYVIPKILAYTLTSPRFAVPMMKILRGSAALTMRGVVPLAANQILQHSPGEDTDVHPGEPFNLPNMIAAPPRVQQQPLQTGEQP
jgi:hypothetical protein